MSDDLRRNVDETMALGLSRGRDERRAGLRGIFDEHGGDYSR
jgi:hypothetical protein